jgi:AraC-like DNA-binding protein
MNPNTVEFAENLAHFTHGMTLMFFIIASIDLYLRKNKNSLLKFFFWVMLFWTFIELKDMVYLIDGLWDDDALGTINLSLDTWCVPVTILFMFKVLSPRWVNWKRGIIVFAPFLLLTVLYVVSANTLFFKFSLILSLVFGISAIFIVFRVSRKYDQYLKDNFSNLEHLTVGWLRTFITMLFFCLMAWGVTNWESTWFGDIFFYIFTVTVWVIFYFYSKGHTLVEVPDLLNFKALITNEKEPPVPEQENIHKNQNGNFAFTKKLARLMEIDCLYLNPNLTIEELTNAVGTNRTYLSNYLHKELNTNFYEYVNFFRIQKACKMLLVDETEKIETIAEACGFNSISTFRRAFVKQTGKTPSEYKENHS